jgi:tRNA 2-thiouridine synthesizing protein A
MIRIDARNSITPLTLLQIGSVMRGVLPGGELEILCDDESTMKDIQKIHPNYECTQVEQKAEGGCLFLLKKKQPFQREEHIMSEAELSNIQANSTADARGSACPGPLLEAKKGIGKVKVGEVLEIYSNDSGTRTDIPAWSNKVGHEYLGMLSVDGYDKHFIRRTK